MCLEVDAYECRACRVLPHAVAWPQYETADVCCLRCGQGITGWPIEDVVAAWNKHQASLRIFTLTPPQADNNPKETNP